MRRKFADLEKHLSESRRDPFLCQGSTVYEDDLAATLLPSLLSETKMCFTSMR